MFLHMSWQPDIDESQDIGQDHFLKGGRELLILSQHLVVAGLWIRIDLMRICIQHFFLIADPDPVLKSMISMTKKLKKFTEKKWLFFYKTLQFSYR